MLKLLWGLIEISGVTADIANKLLSGRYYLTLVGGIVFAFAVWQKILEPQATSAILTAIFMSYFQRPDRQQNGVTKSNT